MIFLTVGTQLPFDRLARGVDAWCEHSGRGGEVFGQVGHINSGSYRPCHFEWVEKVDPGEFKSRVAGASLIVSHAGMGSIIAALSSQKPIVIMPRRVHFGEHRNDHQFATLQRFRSRAGIIAAENESDLSQILTKAADGEITVGRKISPFADDQLIATLRDFIHKLV